jgi:hypothetical protein
MVVVIVAKIFIIIEAIMVEFMVHIDINWVIIMEDIKVIEEFNNQEFINLVKHFYFINYL